MRKQLDVDRYDAIRALCEGVGEIVSKTSGQAYVAPVRETEEEEEEAVLIQAMDSGEEKDEEEAVDPAQIDAEVAQLEAQLAALRSKKEKASGYKSPKKETKSGWGF